MQNPTIGVRMDDADFSGHESINYYNSVQLPTDEYLAQIHHE
jgi:hypothetical protein